MGLFNIGFNTGFHRRSGFAQPPFKDDLSFDFFARDTGSLTLQDNIGGNDALISTVSAKFTGISANSHIINSLIDIDLTKPFVIGYNLYIENYSITQMPLGYSGSSNSYIMHYITTGIRIRSFGGVNIGFSNVLTDENKFNRFVISGDGNDITVTNVTRNESQTTSRGSAIRLVLNKISGRNSDGYINGYMNELSIDNDGELLYMPDIYSGVDMYGRFTTCTTPLKDYNSESTYYLDNGYDKLSDTVESNFLDVPVNSATLPYTHNGITYTKIFSNHTGGNIHNLIDSTVDFLPEPKIPQKSGGNIYWVRPVGTTYGTGSGLDYANAFSGFGGIDTLQAGDTLMVRGTHTEYMLLGSKINVGDDDNYIVIDFGSDAETDYGSIDATGIDLGLNGYSRYNLAFLYPRITNATVTNFNLYGDCYNIIVKHGEFSYSGNQGTQLLDNSKCTFWKCKSHHNVDDGHSQHDNGEGIYYYSECYNNDQGFNIVESCKAKMYFCDFHDNTTYDIWLANPDAQGSVVLIAYSTTYEKTPTVDSQAVFTEIEMLFNRSNETIYNALARSGHYDALNPTLFHISELNYDTWQSYLNTSYKERNFTGIKTNYGEQLEIFRILSYATQKSGQDLIDVLDYINYNYLPDGYEYLLDVNGEKQWDSNGSVLTTPIT